jgi:hypothetical protein
MTLPIAAVERLFDRLSMTYGTEFKNKWTGMPLKEIKTHWAYELSQFAGNLNAIGWALQNLPDRCPNLIEFKSLCKQAPRTTTIALDAPKVPIEVVDTEIFKIISSLVKTPESTGDHKRWARRLKERHEKGEQLSLYQINCYKVALNLLS